MKQVICYQKSSYHPICNNFLGSRLMLWNSILFDWQAERKRSVGKSSTQSSMPSSLSLISRSGLHLKRHLGSYCNVGLFLSLIHSIWLLFYPGQNVKEEPGYIQRSGGKVDGNLIKMCNNFPQFCILFNLYGGTILVWKGRAAKKVKF